MIGWFFTCLEMKIATFCRWDDYENVGINVGVNVGLNATEKKMLEILLDNPDKTAESMATSLGVTKRTIERNLKKLQEKGILVRSGSRKTGKWIVIKWLSERPEDQLKAVEWAREQKQK